MRRLLALGALLALTLAACGDDGGGGRTTAGEDASAGLLVGQRIEDGELDDVLALIDPDRPGDESVEVAEVSRGIPVGVNRALYESGADIVLLDAERGEVESLDLRIGEIDLAYSRSSVAPGGDRYVVLLAPTGTGAALVDLEEVSVTDLVEQLAGEAELVLGAEMSDDGAVVLLNTEDGAFLVPTDDPEATERLGDGAGQLLDGGSSVLLTGSPGVVVRDLDSGDETVITEGDGGALAVGDRILVGRDDEAVLLDPGSDDVVASAPFSAGGVAPVAVGDTVLLPGGGEEPSWTLVDGTDGTATPLPDLDGLEPAFSGRPSRWVPFLDEDDGTLVGVDTEDGSVQPVLELEDGQQLVGLPSVADAGPSALVSTDDADGTHALLVDLDAGGAEELGTRIQGATFSPDGTRVAWSSGEDAELRIGPVDDVAAAEVVTAGVALPVWLNGG